LQCTSGSAADRSPRILALAKGAQRAFIRVKGGVSPRRHARISAKTLPPKINRMLDRLEIRGLDVSQRRRNVLSFNGAIY
jgi:hypothetical protein